MKIQHHKAIRCFSKESQSPLKIANFAQKWNFGFSVYLGKMTGIFSKASQKAQQQPSSHHPPKLSFEQIPDFLNIFRIIEFCAHLVGYWDSWKSMSLLCDVEMSLGGVTVKAKAADKSLHPNSTSLA